MRVPVTRLRRYFAILLALAALPWAALAIHPGSELRDLELRVSESPRKSLADATSWQAEAQRAGNRPLQLKSLRLQALALEQLEEAPRLAEVASRGLALARELQHREAECEFVAARAGAHRVAGRYAESARDYAEALRLAEAYALEDHQARFAVSRGHVEHALGRIPEALDWIMKGHARYERIGDRFGMSYALSALANVHGRQEAGPADLEKAVTYNTRSLELSQPEGGRSDRATDYYNLGTTYLRLKNHELAQGYLEKSLALFRELGDELGVAYADHRLGLLEAERRRPREALALQDRALAIFARTGSRAMELLTQLARAEALSLIERRGESLEALARARAVAQQLGSAQLAARYHEAAARIHARFGEFDKAYAESQQLREAEKKRDELARTERAAEMQARFELQQKEAENSVLRARERESEARRLALVLSLILSLVVLGALAFILADYIRRHRRVANLALRDELTGIANRRSIVEYGRLQVRNSRRTNEGLAIALIDLDRFKSVNDELGHAVGDRVLMAFATTCSQQLRSLDRLGRFGGEEFLLVMPGADLAQIPHVFERLRKALNERPIEGLPAGRQITFSLGASEFRGVADDLESLIQRADRALYRAKESGRDRFETG
jgi:diguanylate cyclase (GGDEF)-like protein